MKEKIVLLGGTGFTGRACLDVLRKYSSRFYLVGISAYQDPDFLATVIEEFTPQYVCLGQEDHAFIERFPGINFSWGDAALTELAELNEADSVIQALPGMSGMLPLLAAIRKGKRIYSATQAPFIAAGDILRSELAQSQAEIIPLDKSLYALFSLYNRFEIPEINRLILTVSGGPFLHQPITEETGLPEIMKFPAWNRDPALSVHAATLADAGLQVLAARHFFGLEYDRIQTLTHPQGEVQGILETTHGSRFYCTTPSDIRYTVTMALLHPQVPADSSFCAPLDRSQSWTLDTPDPVKFPLLEMAYQAGRQGGLQPAVFQAALEVIVEKFLAGIIPFLYIPAVIGQIMENIPNKTRPVLEEILIADKTARIRALDIVNAILKELPEESGESDEG